jgi:UDP:flavonoid glycosyltransferase YjiC (YdhE family)
MYTKPFPTLPPLLDYLKKKQYPTFIYPDGLHAQMIKDYSCDTLRFSDKPLDMDTIGKTARVGICNGNFGTTCQLLMNGLPLLLLPLQAEQHIVSRNVDRLGAGLCAPLKAPAAMVMKLEALIADSKYRNIAADFSQRYANMDESYTVGVAVAAVDKLLKQVSR